MCCYKLTEMSILLELFFIFTTDKNAPGSRSPRLASVPKISKKENYLHSRAASRPNADREIKQFVGFPSAQFNLPRDHSRLIISQ